MHVTNHTGYKNSSSKSRQYATIVNEHGSLLKAINFRYDITRILNENF